MHVEFEQRSNLKEFVNLIREKGIAVISVEHNTAYSNSGLSVYSIMLALRGEKKYRNHQLLIDELKQLSYIEYIEEMF